jgi:hypothetical protein
MASGISFSRKGLRLANSVFSLPGLS